ncbi:iron-sulfur cluster assembly 1 homolog, mitochondrial isoform X2 [Mesocricetus auratus]|uniref:Iron-sulfur cluster assembly 1 homolog, mitochondrial isoform X2 n=1 Tax=Mesocricetus auratus TaxID=10036 RepID=A0ABM2YEG1_MESAU|nr:iron-sulfur cluster assembly 1 homolog, mitochondrial isoform X2 [Mesocricetus auratus]
MEPSERASGRAAPGSRRSGRKVALGAAGCGSAPSPAPASRGGRVLGGAVCLSVSTVGRCWGLRLGSSASPWGLDLWACAYPLSCEQDKTASQRQARARGSESRCANQRL